MFQNRKDAALQLAERLKGRRLHEPLVLAIPRGGVVIGAVLARELGAELDVVLARKLRAPGQPELAIGAISEAGEVYLNQHAEDWFGDLKEYLDEEVRFQQAEIARRRKLYRGARPAAAIAGRSVIVTDDGIATGSTMIAALKVIRSQRPRDLIVAVPVGSPDRLEEVRPGCDEIVCLESPTWFAAIGQFYVDFHQVSDTEVVRLLREFAPRPLAAELPRKAPDPHPWPIEQRSQP